MRCHFLFVLFGSHILNLSDYYTILFKEENQNSHLGVEWHTVPESCRPVGKSEKRRRYLRPWGKRRHASESEM